MCFYAVCTCWVNCLCMLMGLWCLLTWVTGFPLLCSRVVFYLSGILIDVSRMYERENGKVFMMLLDVCARVSASGLRRFSLWCIHVCQGVPLLPVLVTWLLPVAATTYKLAVIKVFDLLCLPAETHIARPANTVLLPLWSMTEGEARGTHWQCRDWTRGCGDGGRVRQGWEERQNKLVKRKSE